MDMYFWHFSVFTMQLLVGLVAALVAVELWRLCCSPPGTGRRPSSPLTPLG